jgi:CRP/FNR family cyclic AMP-dependent transcriptional regulator
MISSLDLRASVNGFDTLPVALVDRISSLSTERQYAENQSLFRAGDRADGLYFLLSGRVRVSRPVAGRTSLLHLEHPGGVLGEIPVLGGGTFPATAIATVASRCAHLPTAAVERLVREEPEFGRFALRRLATRAHSLLTRIDELTAMTITSRLARYLADRARQSAGKDFTLGMSQQSLADELGTAREVLVRSLGVLVDVRAIRRTGRARFAVDREGVLIELGA